MSWSTQAYDANGKPIAHEMNSADRSARNRFGIGPDPYVDVPLFESADDLERIERTRGICQICGQLTDNVDELLCAECE